VQQVSLLNIESRSKY